MSTVYGVVYVTPEKLLKCPDASDLSASLGLDEKEQEMTCTEHPGQTYGEIQYTGPLGDLIHSDVCLDLSTDEGKHTARLFFDEWLTQGGGTGVFYLGDPREAGYMDDPEF